MEALTRRAMARGGQRLALLALAWCTITGGVFGGCRGLFTPAIPEPPRGQPIIPNYRDPEATLRTMEKAMQAKGDGAAAWLGAFADPSRPEDGPAYLQLFDPADLAFFQGACTCEVPTSSGFRQEELFYHGFLNELPSDTRVAFFDSVVTAPPDPQPTDTEALLYRSYRVEATAQDGSTRIIAVGFANLTFTKNAAGNWLITRWNDHFDPAVGVDPSDQMHVTLGRRRLEYTR